ncbi:MAG TPA: 2-phosphosulfolactate phosphatase [Candidatus Dormibacteraeota bacterium]|nr:2-phosphosulfolactate phosphatase [Candidatus Dormibacteraeota bacterium]
MPSVRIEVYLAELRGYARDAVVVGVDVIRSTTTAITAVAGGRRCFVAANLDEVAELQARLEHPLLVGELGGNMPYGFDLNNSPAAIARAGDPSRPAILLSTSGTRLLRTAAAAHPTTFLACLRNWEAQAAELVRARPPEVVLLGAGTRGEFREEDQLCCAWIAGPLIDAGYDADDETRRVVDTWRDAPAAAITEGKSARYLRDSGQLDDLSFILEHVTDVTTTYEMRNSEVVVRTGATS